jgi:hypothetical protein
MTVWIYVDTSKQVGDKDHLKVLANEDAAEAWLQQNDPDGVAGRRTAYAMLVILVLPIVWQVPSCSPDISSRTRGASRRN